MDEEYKKQQLKRFPNAVDYTEKRVSWCGSCAPVTICEWIDDKGKIISTANKAQQ